MKIRKGESEYYCTSKTLDIVYTNKTACKKLRQKLRTDKAFENTLITL